MVPTSAVSVDESGNHYVMMIAVENGENRCRSKPSSTLFSTTPMKLVSALASNPRNRSLLAILSNSRMARQSLWVKLSRILGSRILRFNV